MDDGEPLKLVDKALETLRDHFDAVQIFAMRYDGEDTGSRSITKGSGDFWTRYGRVKGWIVEQEQDLRNEMDNEG